MGEVKVEGKGGGAAGQGDDDGRVMSRKEMF